MKMIFLQILIYLQILGITQSITAAIAIFEDIINYPPLHRIRSCRNTNDLLAQSKFPRVVIENKTAESVRLIVFDFYHESFEEADFSSNEDVAPLFGPRYKVISATARTETDELGFTGEKSQRVIIQPYSNKSEETATILESHVTIPPGKREIIEAINLSYIGRLICETANKYISYEISDKGKIKLIIHDRPYSLPFGKNYEKNLSEMAALNRLSLPFLNHLLSDVFPYHGFTKENFYQKLAEVHQEGIALIDKESGSSVIPFSFNIPLITHTLLTKKREGVLFSDNHKRWLLKSIKTLPKLFGWQHIVWVNEDESLLSATDLGDLAGHVEIRAIATATSDLSCLADINELIKLGHYHHASSLLRYVVLHKYGGVFRGTDTEITQDIAPFNARFAFYGGIETNTARMVGSGFLAAAPGHPVIREALTLALLHIHAPPAYLLPQADKLGDYYIKSGNGVLSIAFQKQGKAGRDMIFGPRVFSPLRPAADITSFEDTRLILTPETHAIHYAEGLWRK